MSLNLYDEDRYISDDESGRQYEDGEEAGEFIPLQSSSSPVVFSLKNEAPKENDQHQMLHDCSNVWFYHCQRCNDIYASHVEMASMPRCQTCKTNEGRVLLPADVITNGFLGLIPLFCCPVCKHHWLVRNATDSRCRMCRDNNRMPPLIKPSQFGVGWTITRFMGKPSVGQPYPPPSRFTGPPSSDMRRSNGNYHHQSPPKDRERDREPRDLRDTVYDRLLNEIRDFPDKYELEFFTKNVDRLRPFLPVGDVMSAATAWLCATQPDIDKKTAREFVMLKLQNDQPNSEQTYFNCPFCNNNCKMADSYRRLCDGGKDKSVHSVRGCKNRECSMHVTCHAHVII